jgi:hypothetical protein
MPREGECHGVSATSILVCERSLVKPLQMRRIDSARMHLGVGISIADRTCLRHGDEFLDGPDREWMKSTMFHESSARG